MRVKREKITAKLDEAVWYYIHGGKLESVKCRYLRVRRTQSEPKHTFIEWTLKMSNVRKKDIDKWWSGKARYNIQDYMKARSQFKREVHLLVQQQNAKKNTKKKDKGLENAT